MSVIDWLLDSDPAIRWQVMRDLLDAPELDYSAERARVEKEGWGTRLLSYEDEGGNKTDFRFESWRAEKARPDADFHVTGPKGTRVVEP